MIVLPDGSYLLNAGESIPFSCVCGLVYQPEIESECSNCPNCNHLNIHAHQEVVAVEAEVTEG